MRPRAHHYMNAGGFCHAGDMFEHGTPSIPLYDADELVRIVNVEKGEAWWQGHRDVCTDCNCPPDASPYGDATAAPVAFGWVEAIRQQQRVERVLLLVANARKHAGNSYTANVDALSIERALEWTP